VTPLYPQKLALTSPTGGGCSVGIVRSRTKATEIFFIGHRDNVLARCDSIFPLLRCQGVWIKRAHNFLSPKSSFRINITTVLRMFKDSAIIFDAIRRSFLTKSATAAMFTSVRVDFRRRPLKSSSISSLPSQNREYHLKTLDRFKALFP